MNRRILSFAGGAGSLLGFFGKNGRLGHWFQALDRILRGEATRPAALRAQSIDMPVMGLSIVLLGLAVSYGLCMGMYAGCRPDEPSSMQWLACTIKVPALFFLTLLVTFPSLYVFNALVGSRLQIGSVLQLLVAALAVNLAVLASLGPIVAFFSFSTTSSAFMVLLNVFVFALSGILGMAFLLQTLQRLSVAREMAAAASPPQPQREPQIEEQGTPCNLLSPGPLLKEHSSRKSVESVAQTVEQSAVEPSPLDPLRGHVLGRHVKTIFVCWIMTFGVVGGQMAWVLRPFFGAGDQPFVWFAPRGSNFFEGVLQAISILLR